MITCTKCGLSEPHVTFKAQRRQCVGCRKKYMQGYLKTYGPAYYRENKAEVNRKVVAIHKRSRHERYSEIQKLKASPCLDCKKSFPYFVMDFDHRDPSVKVADISLMVKTYVPWPKVLEEIAKCDLVCACCHRLRTYHGSNSYRTRRFVQHDTILSELKSSMPCLDCGESFKSCQMDFDHLGDKVDNVARLVGGTTEVLLAEVRKCHLVCANCHRVRGNTGLRPEAPSHGDMLVQKFSEIAARTALPSDRRYNLGVKLACQEERVSA